SAPAIGRIRQGSPTTSYRGVAQLVARLLWVREAQVRAVALGKPGKPWDSWADSTFPLAGNWSKIGVDHMFDHNWKISYPGVAQLVARLLWEHIPPIHEDKTTIPQPAGTLPEAGIISAKPLVKERP